MALSACRVVEPPDVDHALDPVLAEVIAAHDVPAAAACIGGPGFLVCQGVAGVRARGRDEPATPMDSWHIGSCTKWMTAYALATLVERGRLRWSTTMAEVFPELAARMHPTMRDVSVEDLVEQRSGLPANDTVGSPFTRRIDRHATPTQQRLEIVEAALAAAPVGRPGIDYAYANTNYLIAGAVIEQRTGESWSAVMQDLCRWPLQVSVFGTGQSPNVRGHRRLFGKAVPLRLDDGRGPIPEYYGPAGDVNLPVVELKKFATRMRDILTSEAGARLLRGFAVRDGKIAHHGTSPWWHCYVEVELETGRTVVVACNHGGERGAACVQEIVERLRDL